MGASTPTAATVSAPTTKQSSSLAQATLSTGLPVVATEAPILSFGRQYVIAVSVFVSCFGDLDPPGA